MCCRCAETVLSDILSRRAIFLFDSPSAASSITSRSRAVSIRDILRTLNKLAKNGGEPTLVAGDLYEMGGVRLKPPDGSGPDRTPAPTQREFRGGKSGLFEPEFRRYELCCRMLYLGHSLGCCIRTLSRKTFPFRGIIMGDDAPEPLPWPAHDARQHEAARRPVAVGRLRALPP